MDVARVRRRVPVAIFEKTYTGLSFIIKRRTRVVVISQAYCTLHAGRTEPSLGRRRRAVNGGGSGDTPDGKNQTVATERPVAETAAVPADEEKVRQVIEVLKNETSPPRPLRTA